MANIIKRSKNDILDIILQKRRDQNIRWHLLHVKISKLKNEYQGGAHVKITCGVLSSCLEEFNPKTLLCDNNDLVVVFDYVPHKMIEKAIKEVCVLYEKDPLFSEGSEEDLCSFYHSNHNLDIFIKWIKTTKELKPSPGESYFAAFQNFQVDESVYQKALVERQNRSFLKILFIEDQKFSRNIINQTISDQSKTHEIIFAEDGLKGLDKYMFHVPDIVFLDIGLPTVSGLEVLEKITNLDQDAFVVMLTAEKSHESVKKCIALGAKGYIVKPFQKKNIDKYIRVYQEKHAYQFIDNDDQKIGHSIIDPEFLYILRGNKKKDLLINLFMNDAQACLENLQKSIDNKDYSLWEENTHSLSGLAANLNAHQLQAVCKDMHQIKNPLQKHVDVITGYYQNVYSLLKKV